MSHITVKYKNKEQCLVITNNYDQNETKIKYGSTEFDSILDSHENILNGNEKNFTQFINFVIDICTYFKPRDCYTFRFENVLICLNKLAANTKFKIILLKQINKNEKFFKNIRKFYLIYMPTSDLGDQLKHNIYLKLNQLLVKLLVYGEPIRNRLKYVKNLFDNGLIDPINDVNNDLLSYATKTTESKNVKNDVLYSSLRISLFIIFKLTFNNQYINYMDDKKQNSNNTKKEINSLLQLLSYYDINTNQNEKDLKFIYLLCLLNFLNQLAIKNTNENQFSINFSIFDLIEQLIINSKNDANNEYYFYLKNDTNDTDLDMKMRYFSIFEIIVLVKKFFNHLKRFNQFKDEYEAKFKAFLQSYFGNDLSAFNYYNDYNDEQRDNDDYNSFNIESSTEDENMDESDDDDDNDKDGEKEENNDASTDTHSNNNVIDVIQSIDIFKMFNHEYNTFEHDLSIYKDKIYEISLRLLNDCFGSIFKSDLNEINFDATLNLLNYTIVCVNYNCKNVDFLILNNEKIDYLDKFVDLFERLMSDLKYKLLCKRLFILFIKLNMRKYMLNDNYNRLKLNNLYKFLKYFDHELFTSSNSTLKQDSFNSILINNRNDFNTFLCLLYKTYLKLNLTSNCTLDDGLIKLIVKNLCFILREIYQINSDRYELRDIISDSRDIESSIYILNSNEIYIVLIGFLKFNLASINNTIKVEFVDRNCFNLLISNLIRNIDDYDYQNITSTYYQRCNNHLLNIKLQLSLLDEFLIKKFDIKSIMSLIDVLNTNNNIKLSILKQQDPQINELISQINKRVEFISQKDTSTAITAELSLTTIEMLTSDSNIQTIKIKNENVSKENLIRSIEQSIRYLNEKFFPQDTFDTDKIMSNIDMILNILKELFNNNGLFDNQFINHIEENCCLTRVFYYLIRYYFQLIYLDPLIEQRIKLNSLYLIIINILIELAKHSEYNIITYQNQHDTNAIDILELLINNLFFHEKYYLNRSNIKYITIFIKLLYKLAIHDNETHKEILRLKFKKFNLFSYILREIHVFKSYNCLNAVLIIFSVLINRELLFQLSVLNNASKLDANKSTSVTSVVISPIDVNENDLKLLNNLLISQLKNYIKLYLKSIYEAYYVNIKKYSNGKFQYLLACDVDEKNCENINEDYCFLDVALKHLSSLIEIDLIFRKYLCYICLANEEYMCDLHGNTIIEQVSDEYVSNIALKNVKLTSKNRLQQQQHLIQQTNNRLEYEIKQNYLNIFFNLYKYSTNNDEKLISARFLWLLSINETICKKMKLDYKLTNELEKNSKNHSIFYMRTYSGAILWNVNNKSRFDAITKTQAINNSRSDVYNVNDYDVDDDDDDNNFSAHDASYAFLKLSVEETQGQTQQAYQARNN